MASGVLGLLGARTAAKSLRPALDMSFLRGELPPGVTFTRSSNATVTGPDGVMRWAPANYVRWSEDLSQANWDKLGAVTPTVTPGQPDPEGGATAWLVDVSMAGDCRVAQGVPGGTPAGGTITASVWMRTVPGDPDGLLGMSVRKRDGSTINYQTPLNSEWRRVVITYDAGTGGTTPLVWYASRAIAGHTLTRCLLWHPQVESGDEARAYIRTEALPVYGPRFNHDSLGVPLGLLVEGQRTNSIPNSMMMDAAVGVLPAGWSAATANGIASEVVGVGAEAGRPYVDVRVHGTASLTAYPAINPIGVGVQSAATGQAWTASAVVSRVGGGSLPWTVICRGRTSGGSLVSGQNAIQPCAFDGGRTAAAFSFTDATVAFVQTSVQATVPQGTVVDEVIRISAPQLEQGPTASSFIPTFGAAATRTADVPQMPTAGWFNQGQGTFLVSVHIDGQANGTARTFFDIHKDTQNRIQMRRESGGGARPLTLIGNVDQWGSGLIAMPAGASSAAMSYDGTSAFIFVNGNGPLADATCAIPADLNTIRFGRAQWNAEELFGHIRRIAYYPVALTDTQLQALTAP